MKDEGGDGERDNMLRGELQPEVVGEAMSPSELRGEDAEEAMTGAILRVHTAADQIRKAQVTIQRISRAGLERKTRWSPDRMLSRQ